MSRTRSSLFTSTMNFAHLLGLPASAKAPRADEREDERRDDDEQPEGRRAEDDQRREDANRAEEGDDDTETDDDSEVDDDGKLKKGKKGKKAKSAEPSDDEECDEEMSDDDDTAAAARAGRAFERARCAAIFASPPAGKRPDLAAHFAFKTNMSAAAAVDLLKATAAGVSAAPWTDRRAERPRVNLSEAPSAQGSGPSFAQRVVAAAKRARGEA